MTDSPILLIVAIFRRSGINRNRHSTNSPRKQLRLPDPPFRAFRYLESGKYLLPTVPDQAFCIVPSKTDESCWTFPTPRFHRIADNLRQEIFPISPPFDRLISHKLQKVSSKDISSS